MIGHTECGVEKLAGERILSLMEERGISREHLAAPGSCGVDLEQWLTGFDNVESGVQASVSLLREHPLLPSCLEIDGCVIDITTGELFPV